MTPDICTPLDAFISLLMIVPTTIELRELLMQQQIYWLSTADLKTHYAYACRLVGGKAT